MKIAEVHVFLLPIIMILCTGRGIVQGANSKPMFVFGDSYLDTGNHNHSDSPWKPPYGFTWPGRPAGRFSDGRILTDFIAKTVGSSTPIPYRTKDDEIQRREFVKYGVNFAVGGSGAFEAFDFRNLSIQVDYLMSMLEDRSIKLPPLQKTPVLLSTGGNDYARFLVTNGSIMELPDLTRRIVGEITRNVKRLHNLGMRRFAVSNLGPVGCTPYQTVAVSYKHCIGALNVLVTNHNRLLVQEVHATLSALNDADFIILDQFRAFSHVINHPQLFDLEDGLKPCCHSKVGRIPICGLMDHDGKALYEVCTDPGKHLFWDAVHPTQAGWTAVAALIIGQQNSTRKTHTFSAYDLATWLSAHRN